MAKARKKAASSKRRKVVQARDRFGRFTSKRAKSARKSARKKSRR